MKNRYLILILALGLGIFFTRNVSADDQILENRLSFSGQKYVPGEIIVKFKPGVKDKAIADLNSKHSVSVLYHSQRAGFERLKVPAGKTVSEMAEIYKRNPNVEYAEPNYIVYALWVPNDQYYSYQWHLDNPVYGGIGAEEAWNLTPGGNPNVIVAVIDSGVAYENYTQVVARRNVYYYKAPDLAQTIFVPGYDFINNDSHPNDDLGHGTHVTGTIAQSTNNAIGVAGAAFSCSIMPVKVLDKNGSGTAAGVSEGIIWAADHGAKVINMSLGGSQPSTTIENACADAYNNGVTIVCAAGNDGQPVILYPAAYDAYCIAVGATRYDETKTYYSNYGNSLDLTAPGGDVGVDQNGDGYGDGVLQQTFLNGITNNWAYVFYEGTSMAAPHVSAVAALLISANVADTPDEIRTALQSTAKDLGAAGFDPDYGWGRVDAFAALNWTPGPDIIPPVISNGTPAGTISNNTVTLSVTTNELALCKGSIDADNDYAGMDLLFTADAEGASHTCVVNLSEGPHTVYVKAKDNAENITLQSFSWNLTIDTTAPAQVTAVTVTTVSAGQLNISWANNSEVDLDHYNIYRSVSADFIPGQENLITSLAGNFYSDAGLLPSTTYYYRVTAGDSAGNEGIASEQASGTTSQLPPEIEVFSDSFEVSEWNGLWTEDSQNDWYRSNQRALAGQYSAEVDGSASDAKLISIPINLQGKTNAAVSFSWYIESGLDTGEYLAFDVSTNGGTTWVEKARLRGNVDSEGAWHNVRIELNSINSLRIRFRGKMSEATEDADVDMVKVIAK